MAVPRLTCIKTLAKRLKTHPGALVSYGIAYGKPEKEIEDIGRRGVILKLKTV
jgi:hypothetical protein